MGCTCVIFLLHHVPCIQLAHPVLASLQSTTYRWLIDLLKAFNTGELYNMYFLDYAL